MYQNPAKIIKWSDTLWVFFSMAIISENFFFRGREITRSGDIETAELNA